VINDQKNEKARSLPFWDGEVADFIETRASLRRNLPRRLV